MHVVVSECSLNHHISRNTKEYNNLNYISFKIVPLRKYTLLLVTEKVLEPFLEDV